MPRTGRPPKPVELKRRLGNPGNHPLPTPVIVLPAVAGQSADLPTFANGSDMLQRVLDDGARTWIGPTDVPMAELARQLWDDRETARQAWLASSDPNAYRAYSDLTGRLTTCLSALGLDPAARGRLGVAQVKVRSKLEELAERRQRRVAGGRQGS